MAFVVFYTVGGFFTIVLQCPNLAVQWDHTVKGTCWGPRIMKPLSYTNVSLNITTDILFSIVIPIPLLWSLQMNKRQRTSLICIFGLGIFATVAALVRLSFLTIYGKTGDWLWDSRDLTIWTIVESNIGIIAGNLPCLKPLFRAVLGNTHGANSRTTPAPTYGYSTRPYGGGTGLQSANGKGWGALTSSRTADADADVDVDVDVDAPPELTHNLPRSFGVAKDSYLLTTINAEQRESRPQRASARPDEGGSAGAGSSVESLTRTVACSGLGGIKVDTEVNVVEPPSPLYAEFGDAKRKVRESLV
ncbi:hypothetical protein EKO04_010797 [Ascochyta lentis]|uniref:Rhodopsin domain-containing protein n=1 Tax=Ascochyta lentis TaxID=205686 RepID=A0A8H7IUZ9_9PLEO|nr:hypothetical protein EKO04_010797 [Ascochyta lentis]